LLIGKLLRLRGDRGAAKAALQHLNMPEALQR